MGVMIWRRLTSKECRNEKGWFCGDCGNCCTSSVQKEWGDEGRSGYWRICTDDVTLSTGSRLHPVCLNYHRFKRIASFQGWSCSYTFWFLRSLTYPNQLEPLGATSHCWKWQWGVDSVFGSLEATPCAKGGWYSCLYSYLVGMWEGHGWWKKASTDIQQDQITPPLAAQQFFLLLWVFPLLNACAFFPKSSADLADLAPGNEDDEVSAYFAWDGGHDSTSTISCCECSNDATPGTVDGG